MKTCEFHLDADILADLFGLKDVEHTSIRNTLAGKPYIVIRVAAPVGVRPGTVVYGTCEKNPNGSVILGVRT